VTIAVRDLVAIGSIVKAFGIKGELVVDPLTDVPERFRSLQRVFLVSTEQALGSAAGDPITTDVIDVHVEHRGVRMRLTCAQDRTAAESLVGLLVMIPPEETVSLPPGTFFIHEIIGFRAVDEQGTTLGILRDVLRYPAHDVYVIGGQGTPDLLVPAVREFVRSIDRSTRTVTIRVIEGMQT
jgi:16S rRNA processing protein RimM